MNELKLYEILVPTVSNEGKPFRLRYHKVWDSFVRGLSGGLTVLKPAKGMWVNEGKLYEERMIPVRIACNESTMKEIANYTMKYYSQIAVMFYSVSSEVYIINGK